MKNISEKRKNIYTIFSFLFFLFFTNSFYSQSSVDSVDLEKVLQKRKKKFVRNKYLKSIVSFDELFPKCYKTKDSSDYNVQKDVFYIAENINIVWNKYKTIDLQETYSGHLVKFGFLYSKPENRLIYVNDDYSGLAEGQIIFIRLDLLRGIKKLVVAYEVTKIDEEHKTIQFCYMNNGVSEGSQKVSLSETKTGQTKIIHKTFFKSESRFRDKRIYPAFHRRVVGELHHNLMNALH